MANENCAFSTSRDARADLGVKTGRRPRKDCKLQFIDHYDCGWAHLITESHKNHELIFPTIPRLKNQCWLILYSLLSIYFQNEETCLCIDLPEYRNHNGLSWLNNVSVHDIFRYKDSLHSSQQTSTKLTTN